MPNTNGQVGTVNYAETHQKKILEKFQSRSLVRANTCEDIKFTDGKTVVAYTPVYAPLQDYNMSAGLERYGSIYELGNTAQEFTCTQDKTFRISIDKRNMIESVGLDATAATHISGQQREVVTPAADRYALGKYAKNAGQYLVADAFDSTNVIKTLGDMEAILNDKLVPDGERFLYVDNFTFNAIRLSSEWLASDELAKQGITGKYNGGIFGFAVVKVPSSYLPKNCQALATYKKSVIEPFRLESAIPHMNPPGLNGLLIEGRYLYDAFVLGAKADGVLACLSSSSARQADPTVSISGGSFTVSGVSDCAVYYTVDGADPRYDRNAKPYSASTAIPSGCTEIKVVAIPNADGKYASNVVTKAVS